MEGAMSSLTLLIIRHAEKPKENWPGPGYDEKGVENSKSLVIRGWQRAGSWAALFGAKLGGSDLPQPVAIYAADPNGQDGDDPSERPYQTICPLAERLKLKPIVTFALNDEKKLVEAVVKLTGVILISWEHKAIVQRMLPAIVDGQPLHGIPTKWDGARFDVVLRFDRAQPDAPWSFKQLFPRLLSGDSDVPLD
jgi:hypothetical protein